MPWNSSSSSDPPRSDREQGPASLRNAATAHASPPKPEPDQAASARLARALRTDVVPNLVRSSSGRLGLAMPAFEEIEIEAFAAVLLGDDDEAPLQWVERLLAKGMAAETLFVELLAPSARLLGELWVEDCADPAAVTFGVGRLHRLMRQLGPVFESESENASNGRRILLATPQGEQHVFGLAMLAEFFRREGWEVVGGTAESDDRQADLLRDEWFDVLGLSVGSELRLPWLRGHIAQLRSVSRNRGLVVMVGGPIFTLNPHWVYEVGADATADAAQAPRLAEKMLGKDRLTRSRRPAQPHDPDSATP